MNHQALSLWELPINEEALISAVFPILNAKLILRLEELGFEENAPISCLKKMPFKGPKIFQIGDSIFSLTKEIASAVTIKILNCK